MRIIDINIIKEKTNLAIFIAPTLFECNYFLAEHIGINNDFFGTIEEYSKKSALSVLFDIINKDDLINLIFNDVYNNINLTGYILQLNYSIVQDDSTTYDPNINIKVSTLRKNIQFYYDNMINNIIQIYQSLKFPC